MITENSSDCFMSWIVLSVVISFWFIFFVVSIWEVTKFCDISNIFSSLEFCVSKICDWKRVCRICDWKFVNRICNCESVSTIDDWSCKVDSEANSQELNDILLFLLRLRFFTSSSKFEKAKSLYWIAFYSRSFFVLSSFFSFSLSAFFLVVRLSFLFFLLLRFLYDCLFFQLRLFFLHRFSCWNQILLLLLVVVADDQWHISSRQVFF